MNLMAAAVFLTAAALAPTGKRTNMQLFLKFERYSTQLALVLSVMFLIIAAVLTMYQVVTRFAFGRPSTWTEVVARSAMVWSAFTGVAVAFRHGSMIDTFTVNL